MKYKDNQIVYEVGDFVVLLTSQYGFYKGDVAKVSDLAWGVEVYVPNRISSSTLAPYVSYGTQDVRPATESEMKSFKEEEYYYLNKELPFAPVGSKIYNHGGYQFEIGSDNMDAFIDITYCYGSGYAHRPQQWPDVKSDVTKQLIFIGKIKDLLTQGWVRKGE